MEANQLVRTQFSSAATRTLQDVDLANDELLSSIDSKNFFSFWLVLFRVNDANDQVSSILLL